MRYRKGRLARSPHAAGELSMSHLCIVKCPHQLLLLLLLLLAWPGKVGEGDQQLGAPRHVRRGRGRPVARVGATAGEAAAAPVRRAPRMLGGLSLSLFVSRRKSPARQIYLHASRDATRAPMALLDEIRSASLWRAAFAEAVGTFLLVLAVLGAAWPGTAGEGPSADASCGCGCVGGAAASLPVALSAAFSCAALSHSLGPASGAQLNPAVTVALLCTRRLGALPSVAYVLAQCLGAVVAAGVVALLLPERSGRKYLVTSIGSEGNAGQALAAELLCSFQLVLSALAGEEHRVRRSGEAGPLPVGLALGAGILASEKFSGGSLNPARSFGPALVCGLWKHHWVYWMGPLLGGLLAAAAHDLVFSSAANRDRLVACATCRDIEITEARSTSRSSLAPLPGVAAAPALPKRHSKVSAVKPEAEG
ncbi:aquaporin-like [Lampetra planeri]